MSQSIAFQQLVDAVGTLETERAAAVNESQTLRRWYTSLRLKHDALAQLVESTESGALRATLERVTTERDTVRQDNIELNNQLSTLQQQSQLESQNFQRQYQELLQSVTQSIEAEKMKDDKGSVVLSPLIRFDATSQTEHDMSPIAATQETTLSVLTEYPREQYRSEIFASTQRHASVQTKILHDGETPRQIVDSPVVGATTLSSRVTGNSNDVLLLEMKLSDSTRALQRAEQDVKQIQRAMEIQLEARDREYATLQQQLIAAVRFKEVRPVKSTGVQSSPPVCYSVASNTIVIESPNSVDNVAALPSTTTNSSTHREPLPVSKETCEEETPVTQQVPDPARVVMETRLKQLQLRITQAETALLIEQESSRLLQQRNQSLMEQLAQQALLHQQRSSDPLNRRRESANNSQTEEWNLWIAKLQGEQHQTSVKLLTVTQARDDLQKKLDSALRAQKLQETQIIEFEKRLSEVSLQESEKKSQHEETSKSLTLELVKAHADHDQLKRRERILQSDLQVACDSLAASQETHQRDAAASREREDKLREQLRKLSATLRTTQESAVVQQYRHERAVVSATAFESMKAELDQLRAA